MFGKSLVSTKHEGCTKPHSSSFHQFLFIYLVLNPGGSGGSGGGSSSQLRERLWQFGKLGVYFGVLHLAYMYMSSGESSLAAAPPTKNQK